MGKEMPQLPCLVCQEHRECDLRVIPFAQLTAAGRSLDGRIINNDSKELNGLIQQNSLRIGYWQATEQNGRFSTMIIIFVFVLPAR